MLRLVSIIDTISIGRVHNIGHNYKYTVTEHLQCLLVGVVYAYLASGAGRSAGRGTFRALTRGFIHWQSGRIENLEVNVNHPLYCHVRSTMKPSMKAGSYHVGVLLGRDGEVVSSVLAATCECAAG